MAGYISWAIFFVCLDRFFKVLAYKYFYDSGFNIFGEILKFNFVKNYNIAFSIPINSWLLNILLFLILIIIGYILITAWVKKNDVISGYLIILLFGATSNILDRLQYGFVIDYLSLKWFTVFNLADAMICVSVFILIYKKTFRNRVIGYNYPEL
jgi:signal peptidase II